MVSYRAKVKSLLKNNKSLAMALQTNESQLSLKHQKLLENTDIIMSSRMKICTLAENLRKAVSFVEEILSTLTIPASTGLSQIKTSDQMRVESKFQGTLLEPIEEIMESLANTDVGNKAKQGPISATIKKNQRSGNSWAPTNVRKKRGRVSDSNSICKDLNSPDPNEVSFGPMIAVDCLTWRKSLHLDSNSTIKKQKLISNKSSTNTNLNSSDSEEISIKNGMSVDHLTCNKSSNLNSNTTGMKRKIISNGRTVNKNTISQDFEEITIENGTAVDCLSSLKFSSLDTNKEQKLISNRSSINKTLNSPDSQEISVENWVSTDCLTCARSSNLDNNTTCKKQKLNANKSSNNKNSNSPDSEKIFISNVVDVDHHILTKSSSLDSNTANKKQKLISNRNSNNKNSNSLESNKNYVKNGITIDCLTWAKSSNLNSTTASRKQKLISNRNPINKNSNLSNSKEISVENMIDIDHLTSTKSLILDATTSNKKWELISNRKSAGKCLNSTISEKYQESVRTSISPTTDCESLNFDRDNCNSHELVNGKECTVVVKALTSSLCLVKNSTEGMYDLHTKEENECGFDPCTETSFASDVENTPQNELSMKENICVKLKTYGRPCRKTRRMGLSNWNKIPDKENGKSSIQPKKLSNLSQFDKSSKCLSLYNIIDEKQDDLKKGLKDATVLENVLHKEIPSSVEYKRSWFCCTHDETIEKMTSEKDHVEPKQVHALKKSKKSSKSNNAENIPPAYTSSKKLGFRKNIHLEEKITDNLFLVTAEVHQPPDGFVPVKKILTRDPTKHMQPSVVLTDIFVSNKNYIASVWGFHRKDINNGNNF